MGLKLETVPIVIYCCFVLHNICEMGRNCEVDDQEVQAQIQRHKRDEERTPNRPGAFYSFILFISYKSKLKILSWELKRVLPTKQKTNFKHMKEI